jgi:nucleoside-triphosphatase THEP1
MPQRLQLLIIRVERDEIGEMEAEIVKFLAEVDEKVKRLEAL